jgi:hypothetical protein
MEKDATLGGRGKWSLAAIRERELKKTLIGTDEAISVAAVMQYLTISRNNRNTYRNPKP